MADNASSVVSISRGARSLFCFNQFIGDVGRAKDVLLSKLKEVKKRRDEATRKKEEIMPTVKKWLDDVEAILQEVQKLQQEVEEGGKKCFNVSLRYSLAEQMANKAKEMRELKSNSNFEPFSHPIQLPGITPKEFEEFNSRKSTYNHLVEAIKDSNKKMVGLYGMWGSGKTALVKEVSKKVVELKLFDQVVVVDVSKTAIVENIQREIAEQLGLEFQEHYTNEMLRNKLKYRKILVILDDVLSNLSLEDIGIPLGEGCCILLTTRVQGVCDSMGCDSKIELPLLKKEEAWTLLKMHADMTNNSSNELDEVGRQIVDECKRLPIAIVAVGSTLKGKHIEGWVTTLWRLQHSQPLDVEEGLKSPYAYIKLKYDDLPTPAAKLLFLLCSMFPKDHKINKEDLIRFGKGMLKLDESVDTMEDARGEILSTINKLIDSHLLMPTNKEAYVKMHDVVRDVALLIGKKRHKIVLVESGEVSKMLKRNENVKDAKVISLWNMEESFKVSNQLCCPTLKILLLHPEKFIDDFGGVEALKILALIQFSFIWSTFKQERAQWSMLQSVVSLTNLHTLCLRGIALGDISFLYKLKGLEILDLRGSSFDELPIEIGDMKKLKLLDLFGCSIKRSPYEVIGRCGQLQELYLWDSKYSIPKNFSVSRLKRYVICDSKCEFSMFEASLLKYFEGCVEALRALCIQGCNVSDLSLFVGANILWVKNCTWDNKDINSEIQRLVVSCCPNKHIVDNISQIEVFSHLITLRLSEMNDLEQVFQDSSIKSSLKNLEELYIEGCHQLHYICFPNSSKLSFLKTLKLDACPMLNLPIFTPSIAQSLVLLEKLYIRRCNNLRHIIAESDEEEGNVVDGDSNSWTLKAFQNLRTLDVDSCADLVSILPLYFAQSLLTLQSLDVRRNPNLKYVIGGRKDDCVSVHQRIDKKDSMEIKVHAPSLTKLLFLDMPEISQLFPQQIDPRATGSENNILWVVLLDLNQLQNQVLAQPLQCFLNLKSLSIIRCKRNKGIFELRVRGAVDGEHVVTQEHLKFNLELSELCLDDLLELEFIWKGPKPILSLHKLEQVRLQNLPTLKTIFTLAIIPSLPELRELHVRECNELEGIFSKDSLKNLSVSSPHVCFPKLSKILANGCKKVKWMFTYSLACHCPSLEKLKIWDCCELEGVVEGVEGEAAGDGDGDEATRGDHLLFLKLNTLCLESLPNLRQIFPSLESKDKKENDKVSSELSKWYFKKLPELEYIWKSNTQIPNLHKLEQLRLFKCPKLRIICTLTIITSLPELRELDAKECDEWVTLKNHSTSSPNVWLPKHSEIWIGECNKVKWMFTSSLPSQSPSLEKLYIYNCSELEGVVEGEADEEATHGGYWLVFPKLNTLSLSKLPKLRQVFPSFEKRLIVDNLEVNILQTEHVFFHLITLRLIEMGSLVQVFQHSSTSLSLPMLQELYIEKCPQLRTIFTLAAITSLPELRKLEVYYCDKVKWVFSYSLACHCPSLEILYIKDCYELERVVEGLEGEATANQLLFPKLDSLQLVRLPKLRQIFPSFENVESPRHIQNKKNENGKLGVMNSELSNLKLYDLPELEYIWKGFTQIVSLYRLENVSLSKCSKLRTIFTHAIIPNLPEFRELDIRECYKLEGIFSEDSLKNLSTSSPNVGFPKLFKISIRQCNKMKWMFTYSLASHCPSLEELYIENCYELEGLVEGEADEEATQRRDQLLFSKLNKIHLKYLPKLKWMLTYSLASHCLSLEELYVYGCSELERLVEGEADEEATQRRDQLLFFKLNRIELSLLPKLREIFPGLQDKHIQDCPKKSENDRILEVVNLELSYLQLNYLQELEYIWKGPTQIMSLHKLEQVILFQCSKLRTIFTHAIIPSLPKLRKLAVYACEEWEGIICEDSLDVSSPSINVCFPKLSFIGIEKCNKVKWVFSSYSLACHCPSLKTLLIADCSEVEGVVNKGSLEIEAHHHLFFPKLTYMSLIKLPKMREMYPGYDFNPERDDIKDCPNIHTPI